MSTPTPTSKNTINLHKVPDLQTWTENYDVNNNDNTKLIKPGDVVSFPPSILGEVLPDYPTTTGTTVLKATTTSSGTETDWADIAEGTLMNVVTSVTASSTDSTIPTAKAVWDARPSVPSAYTSNPAMDGSASAGSSSSWAKGDHVHPTDTSRAPSIHVHGNITNTGDITTSSVTISNNDKIIINDESASKITNGPTFDGSTASKALTQKGTWESFSVQSAAPVIVISSGDETISAADSGKLFLMKHNSGTPKVTINRNNDILSAGAEIEIMNYGTVSITIEPASGAYIKLNGATTAKTLSDQYTSAVLKLVIKGENDTDYDEWVIQGAIS